jgi:hypothetical protein
MDRCPPLSWRAAIGHFLLISCEDLVNCVETTSGGSLLMGGGLDRCDSDPEALGHDALRAGEHERLRAAPVNDEADLSREETR